MRRWRDLFGDWIATKNGLLNTLLAMIETGEITHDQTRIELLAAITTILDAGRAADDLRRDVTAEDIASSLIGIFTVAPKPQREALASACWTSSWMDCGLQSAGNGNTAACWENKRSNGVPRELASIAAWAHKTALVAMLMSSAAERARGGGLPASEYHALYAPRDVGPPARPAALRRRRAQHQIRAHVDGHLGRVARNGYSCTATYSSCPTTYSSCATTNLSYAATISSCAAMGPAGLGRAGCASRTRTGRKSITAAEPAGGVDRSFQRHQTSRFASMRSRVANAAALRPLASHRPTRCHEPFTAGNAAAQGAPLGHTGAPLCGETGES
ncbi:hypothetical protein WMF33_30340 [Sorangium sp. So ce394]